MRFAKAWSAFLAPILTSVATEIGKALDGRSTPNAWNLVYGGMLGLVAGLAAFGVPNAGYVDVRELHELEAVGIEPKSSDYGPPAE